MKRNAITKDTEYYKATINSERELISWLWQNRKPLMMEICCEECPEHLEGK